MALRRKRKRPAPVSADEGSGVTSIRFQPDLRKRLEQEAKRRGRSFSSEVQARLRRSFEEEKLLDSQFGSVRNARIMQIAASIMQMQKNPLNPDADWLDDPVAFLLARNALLAVLDEVRPRVPVETFHGVLAPMIASIFLSASARWEEIAKTDPTLAPFTATSTRQYLDSIVKNNYPEIVSRIGTDEHGREPDDAALKALEYIDRDQVGPQEEIKETQAKPSTVHPKAKRMKGSIKQRSSGGRAEHPDRRRRGG
jgi:hypothetical protein